MKYFFDLQGTLVGNPVITEEQGAELLRMLRLLGHEVIVWSCGGPVEIWGLRSPLRDVIDGVRLKAPWHYFHILGGGGGTCIDDDEAMLTMCERVGAFTMHASELRRFYEETRLMAESRMATA